MSRFYLKDLPIDKVSLQEIVPRLIKLAKEKKRQPSFVTFLNASNFNLIFKDKNYHQILKSTDLLYADGWGVVLAARFLGSRLPGRLTAKDFFEDFCCAVEKEKLSIFFLGGKEEVLKRMIGLLREKFPQIKISGYQNGFFSKKEGAQIITKINRLKPDFLIIGMGSPKQEEWFERNLGKLKIKVGWCVGGLFDFVSKNKPSCPRWLGDLGFEWFFRLITEPRRLWRRYLLGLPEFFYRLIKLKLNL
jgi:N-acetylglucosaminyldiphosphoundecaprenol N-acetyl-beta-D-mannosaminyltransferase